MIRHSMSSRSTAFRTSISAEYKNLEKLNTSHGSLWNFRDGVGEKI